MAIWQFSPVKIYLNSVRQDGIPREVIAHGVAEATHNVMLEEVELMSEDTEANLS